MRIQRRFLLNVFGSDKVWGNRSDVNATLSRERNAKLSNESGAIFWHVADSQIIGLKD